MSETDILRASQAEIIERQKAQRAIGHRLIEAIKDEPFEGKEIDAGRLVQKFAKDNDMDFDGVYEAWEAIQADPDVTEQDTNLLDRVR